MSNKNKSRAVNILTILVVFFTAFQTAVATMPLQNPQTITILGAILMYLVTTLTIWKQKLSIEIQNKSLWPTIVIATIATLGGLNDVFNVIPIAEIYNVWIRWGITFVTMFLNILSKLLWPTEQTTSKI